MYGLNYDLKRIAAGIYFFIENLSKRDKNIRVTKDVINEFILSLTDLGFPMKVEMDEDSKVYSQDINEAICYLVNMKILKKDSNGYFTIKERASDKLLDYLFEKDKKYILYLIERYLNDDEGFYLAIRRSSIKIYLEYKYRIVSSANEIADGIIYKNINEKYERIYKNKSIGDKLYKKEKIVGCILYLLDEYSKRYKDEYLYEDLLHSYIYLVVKEFDYNIEFDMVSSKWIRSNVISKYIKELEQLGLLEIEKKEEDYDDMSILKIKRPGVIGEFIKDVPVEQRLFIDFLIELSKGTELGISVQAASTYFKLDKGVTDPFKIKALLHQYRPGSLGY